MGLKIQKGPGQTHLCSGFGVNLTFKVLSPELHTYGEYSTGRRETTAKFS